MVVIPACEEVRDAHPAGLRMPTGPTPHGGVSGKDGTINSRYFMRAILGASDPTSLTKVVPGQQSDYLSHYYLIRYIRTLHSGCLSNGSVTSQRAGNWPLKNS
ncbi:hypothetical protein CIRG_03026 [Coccidioides immitis RMSCC 2394]|uniref:Uncharacterized protein n=1 Tax=Coccidioides immitis RMSCC 2394 TaxID=404692 RepID=A0A0J6Y8G1_COCIT|nr:hypothetical protein CIRG_03026 [Coccidioides immitis RMSCC 2394]